ncbi:hypothetical protein WQQ_31550 [Hydrocarboniphaga effusa AP103]|uniref:Uncharacterized protein n=1 Tax=Hydrocarboniphaga effusa AP103 TaxID=1172194 RepID=I8T774_9GAMM|nr:hypothetical protein WQQ_31550 [Hydrocarboniphaga effusa AP103]
MADGIAEQAAVDRQWLEIGVAGARLGRRGERRVGVGHFRLW